MIAWSIPSCNTFDTSNLMGIVRIKRVYLKIPSVGECTKVRARTDKSTLEYDILYITGTGFYVNSGSEIRIPIFHL